MKSILKSALETWLRKHPYRIGQIRRLAQRLSPHDTILLEYPVNPKSRWTATSPHPQLKKILDANRARYSSLLATFLEMKPAFLGIKRLKNEVDDCSPCWINGWMPSLDGVAIYGHIATHKPAVYLEVGSGNSTKFACKAIKDIGIKSHVISIDPCPRAEIDQMCDAIVRKPLEDADLSVFSKLQRNDVVYIDCSHRSLMNSDVTTFFLEVLPTLAAGVVVGVHDILLPYDYPNEWTQRWYSEQYLLACYLLADWHRMSVLFPSYFISQDPELKMILDPLWNHSSMVGVETHGCSFWFQMK